MGNKRSKITAQVALILTYLPLTSAQSYSIGSGSSTGSGAAVVEFFNEMVFYTFEVSSIPEITLYFVAPLFGFYMINKNIFELGFESFGERIGRDSYHNTNEDLPTGLKGVALAVSFMTVQVAGIFGTVLLLAAGGLAFIAWFLNHIGLLGDWSSGGSSSGSGGTGGGADVDDVAERVAEELNIGERDEDQIEQDEQQGNVEAAENEIDDALKAFSGAEKDVMEILTMDTNEMDDAILKVSNAAHKVGELEKNDVATIKQLFKELEHKLDKLKEQVTYDADSSKGSGRQNDITVNFASTFGDVNQPTALNTLVQRIEEEVKLVAEGEKNTDQSLEDGVDEMLEASRNMVKIIKFEERLSEDLGRLAQDEEKLKQVIKNSNANSNLIQRLMNERQQLENLKTNLEKLDNYDMLPTVNHALNELEEYLTVEKAEQEELKALHKDIAGEGNKIENFITRIEAHYDNKPGTSGPDNNKLREGYTKTLNQKILSELQGPINDGLETIETQATVKTKHVSQAYQELQQLIS